MAGFHLAQFNIGRMLGPIDGPVMEGFVSQLANINALAEATPGFVWRLQTAEGDATALRPYDDPMMIVNMSVWESLESLHAFVYKSAHVGPLRDRKSWFEAPTEAILVLWWIPAGHIPSVEEAKERLAHLRQDGPTARAFTFRHAFPAPGDAAIDAPEVDAEFCARPA
jgi:heme-degrading monooxygenase HmoA